MEGARGRPGNCCGRGWTWRLGPGSLVPELLLALEGPGEGEEEEAACQTYGQCLAAGIPAEQRVLFLVIGAFHVPRKTALRATGTGPQDPRGRQQVAVRTVWGKDSLPACLSEGNEGTGPDQQRSHFIMASREAGGSFPSRTCKTT